MNLSLTLTHHYLRNELLLPRHAISFKGRLVTDSFSCHRPTLIMNLSLLSLIRPYHRKGMKKKKLHCSFISPKKVIQNDSKLLIDSFSLLPNLFMNLSSAAFYPKTNLPSLSVQNPSPQKIIIINSLI